MIRGIAIYCLTVLTLAVVVACSGCAGPTSPTPPAHVRVVDDPHKLTL